MLKRVMTRFFVVFFVSQNRETLQGNPSVLCVRNILVAKKFMGKRGGGSIKVLRRKFFASECQKVSYITPLGCHYFRVSKIFMLQRVMSRFSFEIFCLTVPRNFVGEPFCAVFQKVSGTD